MKGPLAGIRILDLSRVLAGPWATQLLGDYGADVVKVERPGSGDDTRHWGPPWLERQDNAAERESAYFLATNRNKRSLTVDLSSPAGQELVRELAAQSDVIVENFRAGTLQRWGLDPGRLRESNPRLVVCTISAFAHSSSRGNVPGYDVIIQASGRLMSIPGPAEEEVPRYDSQVAWLANQAMNLLVGGAVPGRLGTAHPNIVPYQAFATADGHIMVAVGNDRQFAECVRRCRLPELAADPRFVRNADRLANRRELVAQLSAAFAGESTSFWLRELGEAGVPCSPINDIGEVFASAYAEECGLVRNMPHPYQPRLPTVANPVRYSADAVSYRLAPPLLGQHSGEVLAEWLGYSARTISELRKAGTI